jgi:hypothetical protein
VVCSLEGAGVGVIDGRDGARQRVGGKCRRPRGGGGDSSHRACMCRKSAGKCTLQALPLVYYTSCKTESVSVLKYWQNVPLGK